MNAYPAYKDSEIEWFGEIPKQWQIQKIKHIGIVNPSKTLNLSKSNKKSLVTFLPMEKVNEDGTYDTEIKKPVESLSSGFTYFERGDVLVAKITPCFENGKGADLSLLDTEFGFGSTEFHVIRPFENKSISRYLYYLTHSMIFRNIGEAFMTGAAGQKRVSKEFIKEFRIGIPSSIDEQQIIADFLDHKTAQIDELISKKQHMIDLL